MDTRMALFEYAADATGNYGQPRSLNQPPVVTIPNAVR